MFAEEWKARQCMVEGDFFLPADSVMATGAICSELAPVDIIVGMTAHASNGQFHVARGLLVAGIACEGLVSPAQCKPGHLVVVKAALLPVPVIVAAGAVAAITPFVDIVPHMAGNASARRFPDRIANPMTRRAARCGMRPDQWETGTGVVIEGRRFPTGRRMTAGAIRSARALVDVVPGVAGDALGRRSSPALASMARETSRTSMRPNQYEAG